MDSIEDFQKKYKHSIGIVNFDGKHLLGEYEEDDEDGMKVMSPVYGTIRLDWDTARECFRGIFPQPGLYNVYGMACEVLRHPERQWKRSITNNNTTVTPIINVLGFNEPNRMKARVSIGAIEKVLEASYPKNLEEALYILETSIAINRSFGISQSITKEDKKILWFKSNPVGFVLPDKKQIVCKFEPLFQEVMDFIKRKEPEWKLVRNEQ